MTREIRIVDVFTERPLAGNQLAVVLDGEGLSHAHMQKIAREMNFSETTFILPADDPAAAARVRIFTPFSELPFAGHPTIGTAWVMVDEGMVTGSLEFSLEEGVGRVPVRGERNDGRVAFWMTHPPVTFGEVIPHQRVAEAIGVSPSELLEDVPAQLASTGYPFLFVALRDPGAVDSAVSERARLEKLFHGRTADAIFVFARAGENRLHSRMFSLDIVEDPATGSASGPLGAFAVKYGLVERAPKVEIVSEQGTKMGRQSFIHITLEYTGAPDAADLPTRIEIGGSVMPVLSGTLSDFS